MARIASEDKLRSLRAESTPHPRYGPYAFDSVGTYKLDEPSVVPPVTSPEHRGVHMWRK
ncbi:hypothetical protein L915_03095, partial [Phytophthora nicotianae]